MLRKWLGPLRGTNWCHLAPINDNWCQDCQWCLTGTNFRFLDFCMAVQSSANWHQFLNFFWSFRTSIIDRNLTPTIGGANGWQRQWLAVSRIGVANNWRCQLLAKSIIGANKYKWPPILSANWNQHFTPPTIIYIYRCCQLLAHIILTDQLEPIGTTNRRQ